MRFKTIDGLRGVAALAVVLYHLNAAARISFDTWVPGWLDWLLRQGFLGVDIFFVLSGFVIAYSIRNADPTASYLGRFALRRSVRLDPPYWVAIFLEIAVQAVALKLAFSDDPLPSIERVVAHFFYLQNLLGYGDIVSIFWTLCFEIQFYLFLVILMIVRERLLGVVGTRVTEWIAAGTLASLFVVSVCVRYEVAGWSCPPGVALIRWYQFFMGACVWWVAAGRIRWPALVGTWGVLIAVIVVQQAPPQQTLPIFVSALIWWSYRRDYMASILSGRTIQFLGAISYSLYLFHTTIGWRFIRLSSKVVGSDASLWITAPLYAAGVMICIFSAWVAWRVLERPSMAFSRRFALPTLALGRDGTR